MVDEAWVAICRVGESGNEACKDLGPREAYGEGLADEDEQVAPVDVPGVSGGLGMRRAKVRGGEDGVEVQKDTAGFNTVTVGRGGLAPFSPLSPVGIGVQRAAAPAAKGEVHTRFEDVTDDGVILASNQIGWQIGGGAEWEAQGRFLFWW